MLIPCKDGHAVDFKKLLAEYSVDHTDMFRDPPRVLEALDRLRIEDKSLVVLYLEMGTHEKVSRLYNCSRPTIQRRMGMIWKQLREMLA